MVVQTEGSSVFIMLFLQMAFIPMTPICTAPSVGQTMCLPLTDEETETEPHGCCLRTSPPY